MPDTQILRAAVAEQASEYTLPDAASFTLKAVNADFDGSVAGSAYLPAVEIVSDSGHVIARAVDPGVSVGAGDSAEASFFPGVKHAASAAAGTAFPFGRAARIFSVQSIPSGSFPDTPISFDVASGTSGLVSFDPAEPTKLTYTALGLYIVYGSVFLPDGAYSHRVDTQSKDAGGAILDQYALGGQTIANYRTGAIAAAGGLLRSIKAIYTRDGSPPFYSQLAVFQNSGAPLDAAQAELFVHFVSPESSVQLFP